MPRRGPQLKNDVDRRMENVVAQQGGCAYFPDRDLARLDRRHLTRWIKDLRKGETELRKFRQRLEALQGEVDRPCPSPRPGGGECGRPVVGRADAIYCTAYCRVQAHRVHTARSVGG